MAGVERIEVRKPVFVIGKNRSGTKWLSNIIGNHPDVAAVQGEDFTGILESNLFFQFPKVFGDLRDSENYCAMAACFSRTSFFQCTGLDERVLFAAKIDDYHEFFRHVMNAYAAKENKPHWLQKTNPLVLPQLHAAFPDAQFIITNRDITDSIRSSLALAKRNGTKGSSIFSEMALYHLGEKIYNQFRGKSNVMFVTFEDLKGNKEAATKRICEFLRLQFDARMLEDAYQKNTSFKNGSSRANALSRTEERCISLFGPLARRIPLGLLKAFRRMFGRNRNPNRSRFISGSFLTLRKQYGWSGED